jgi:hypothetical protein
VGSRGEGGPVNGHMEERNGGDGSCCLALRAHTDRAGDRLLAVAGVVGGTSTQDRGAGSSIGRPPLQCLRRGPLMCGPWPQCRVVQAEVAGR